MKWTQSACSYVAKKWGDSDADVRVIIDGGGTHGFSIQVIQNEGLKATDMQGTEASFSWCVDPVSWQFLAQTTLDVSESTGQLVAHGLPRLGAQH
jgi:Fe-S cluster assembly iron-binding protein IscA